MKTPERLSALRAARKTLRMRDQKIARIKQILESLTSEKGVEIDQEVHEEITEVIKDKNEEIQSLPASDFRRVFWDQQVDLFLLSLNFKALFPKKLGDCYEKVKGKTGIRWHPLFIRWCLNLSRVSPKAYEVMRESGLQMPTRRTLNDYTLGCLLNPGSVTKWMCFYELRQK